MFPAVTVSLLCSPAFDSQFSTSVTYSLADQFPYSNPISSPSTSSLKLSVQFCFVFHVIANCVCCLSGQVLSSDVPWEEGGTHRNKHLLDLSFCCASPKQHIVISLASACQVCRGFIQGNKHMEISDACFPKDTLVILRHTYLGVICQFQTALVQHAHIPLQAQTIQCIYSKEFCIPDNICELSNDAK